LMSILSIWAPQKMTKRLDRLLAGFEETIVPKLMLIH
jgi:hypothetical protein